MHVVAYNTVDSSWSQPPNIGFNGVYVYALAATSSYLFVGGDFGSTPGPYTARYTLGGTTSAAWTKLTVSTPAGSSYGTGPYEVRALVANDDNDVYLGGSFVSLGNSAPAYRIAHWNGTSLESVRTFGGGQGVGASTISSTAFVQALALTPTSNLYVGGQTLTTFGDGVSAMNNIAVVNL